MALPTKRHDRAAQKLAEKVRVRAVEVDVSEYADKLLHSSETNHLLDVEWQTQFEIAIA